MCGERRKDQFFGLFIVLVVFFVYADSLLNGFVSDDNVVIRNNPLLSGSPLSLLNSIDTNMDTELTPYYRPLTYLTFLIEGRLHGFAPLPMHFFNVLLHAANAFLVYRLARTLIDDSYASLLAGLLFAVHPLNAEGVDFISGGRNTMLACFFILTAYLFHRRSVLRENISGALAGSVFFLAGLFSKEMALAVLPFILALEISHYQGSVSSARLRAYGRLLPYAAGTICYLLMRGRVFANFGIQTDILSGLGTRLINNLYIIPRYLLSVIYPRSLSSFYFVPDDLHLLALPLVVAWLCIIAISIWLLKRGRTPATLFGLFWLVVFWLPVSGIFPFPSAPLADRYLYVPAIGLWVVIADQAVRLLLSGVTARRYAAVAAALVLLVLAALTAARNMDWKNNITLASRLVEQYPAQAYGHAGLGTSYLESLGRTNDTLPPENYVHNPGTAFRNKQDDLNLDLAEREFEKALALDTFFPGLHTHMGFIRLVRGDYEGALMHYSEALTGYPLDKEARFNRATTLENLGRYKEAIADYNLFLTTPGYFSLPWARSYAEERVRELTQ